MGDTWVADMTHLLDETGQIASESGPARRLAEHITAIVAMASLPGPVIPPEYKVKCRRRPGRKPCAGHIDADIDPETDEIVWWCDKCDDNGYIQNWKGSMWDLSSITEPH